MAEGIEYSGEIVTQTTMLYGSCRCTLFDLSFAISTLECAVHKQGTGMQLTNLPEGDLRRYELQSVCSTADQGMETV